MMKFTQWNVENVVFFSIISLEQKTNVVHKSFKGSLSQKDSSNTHKITLADCVDFGIEKIDRYNVNNSTHAISI